MDKRLLKTLGFAIVAGVFLGLAFGGMRNRITFESAQMSDGLLSEIDSLRSQLDTLNQTYQDSLEESASTKAELFDQIYRLTGEMNRFRDSSKIARSELASLEDKYNALKEKYEELVPPTPEPPPEETDADDHWGFMGGISVGVYWEPERVLPLPPWK
jgi:uncharacterized membrane-anchored protein YhcB (DUF1043 family)